MYKDYSIGTIAKLLGISSETLLSVTLIRGTDITLHGTYTCSFKQSTIRATAIP